MSRSRLRILTWHVHGNYLYYLTQVPHDFYLVTDAERSPHRSGRSGVLPWGANVHEAPAQEIRRLPFDVVLYQSRDAWEHDRFVYLSETQRQLPTVYLEHDPPQQHPTDTRHWAGEPNVLLVHVTPFNALMWDSGQATTRVIEHGVRPLADAAYTGERASGIVVVNNLATRGRRLGLDVYQDVAAHVPLTLVGMDSERVGGAGEVPHTELPGRMAQHRFLFNPIRYTSLGLAVIEAMMVGVPVVGLATTELVSVIRNGRNGFVDTRVEHLIEAMRWLLGDIALARRLGAAGRRTALERFTIERFVDDWMRALREITR
ncbi:MAG TPA: glycosyltransferase family 4 protein [Burkholderiaceae bacterium]